jgi:thymidylate synthase (FAD)
MPIFIARQWIRHRTACLAGDTLLSYDLPGGARRGRRQHHGMTIERLHRLWHEGALPVTVAKRKPTFDHAIDPGVTYSVPELARVVHRREESLRSMIRDGYLMGTRSNGRLFVRGSAWLAWSKSRASVRVPMRDRAARMRLRMCNEATGEIEHTNVVDVWQSGVKAVFRVTLANGYSIKMTKDHRCLTESGWMTLEEATKLHIGRGGGVTWDGSAPAFAVNGEPLHRSREWLSSRKGDGWSVQRMADEAGMSYHTIRQNLRRLGVQYTAAERAQLSGRSQRGQHRTVAARAPVTADALANIRTARAGAASNFWKGGVTPERANIGRWTREHAQRVHRRNGFACVICGSKERLKAHHVDPVWHNAARARDEDNLTSLCEGCHNELHRLNLEAAFLDESQQSISPVGFWDRHNLKQPRPLTKRKPRVNRLVRAWSKIASIEQCGEEMTYDLEVAGPYHNFVANGLIVHNSVNEYSARYSVVQDRFYHPTIENVRKQSASNRQGGEEPIDPVTAQEFLAYLDKVEEAYKEYQRLMDKGVAREIARIGLPVNVYTEWYWKIDLHNLFHFLSLRMDAHAQQEIRDYANAMYALIQPIVPIAAEAFLDYNFGSLHLSRLEVEALKTGKPLASENKRENAEWEEKKKKLFPEP